LIVLNRPGPNLFHGRGAVAHRFQKRVLDADLGKRLDVFLELIDELSGCCHRVFLLGFGDLKEIE
jgi:hypothetical protein